MTSEQPRRWGDDTYGAYYEIEHFRELDMPSRTLEFVDETPKRPRRTQEEIDAEDDLDHHWVTVLSIEKPVPRHFGDNLGMLPIWVETNADWRQAGVAFDRQQPHLRAIRLEVMAVSSIEHASRFKEALDEALHGMEADHEADPLRYAKFRNGADFGDLEVWWVPFLQDALLRLSATTRGFEYFSRSVHYAMVRKRVLSGRR